MKVRGLLRLLFQLSALLLASCAKPTDVAELEPLPAVPGQDAAQAASRVNGSIGTPTAVPRPLMSYGAGGAAVAPARPATPLGPRIYALNFADTDIREAVAQILGSILRANYTIDPSVHGAVTLRTTTPLAKEELLPTLAALLSEVGATMTQSAGVYQIIPTAALATAVGGPNLAGATVMPLRYVNADDLAKLLQPFAGTTKIAAEPGSNALLISGDPAGREAIIELARSFDIDALANQSYLVMPVSAGDAKEFASAVQSALRAQGSGSVAGSVRVVPLERMNAVLLVSAQPRAIDEARRIYGVLDRSRQQTVRSWHVFYLQNSRANDIAFVLQQAFTPGNVTAVPSPTGPIAPGILARRLGGGGSQAGTPGASGLSAMGTAGSLGATGGIGGGLTTPGGVATGPDASNPNRAGGDTGQVPSLATMNPLFGGLDTTAAGADAQTMRIIPNPQNNAILTYATRQEQDTVEAMLRKIDLVPLQVRIDATIVEVTLNDALRYGTQFFFKSGGINGILSNLNQDLSGTTLSAAAFNTTFPGFVIGGSGLSGAPLAISMLQQVTTVHVLSSPELLVLDNRPARLEVGSLVPFLTQTSQGTLVPNAPVINSIDYHQTGVILDVVPQVNNGGLVALDISQVVSDVDTNPPTAPGVSINSPTFLDRSVQSRVVVQDGQTVGLAGMIRDNVSRGNSGLPWLKDIPILGALAGSQSNQRTRTELLVLITPHVVHDQRDARALTEDMREQMFNAALVPREVRQLRPSGSPDPGVRVRERMRRAVEP